MPAIPTSTRFFLPGVVGIAYYASIAAASMIPTTSEQTASTDLTGEVDDIGGWTTGVAWIETKDAKNRFRPQLPGAITPEASSITFNGSKDGVDVRTILVQDQTGFILIADGGFGTGKKADVFPVIVGNVARLRSLDNAPFKVRVDFGISAKPAFSIALP